MHRLVPNVQRHVKAKRTTRTAKLRPMREEPHKRLKWARERAGIDDATAAAAKFGWNPNTYRSHENGARAISKKAAARYAQALRINAGWLLYGIGTPSQSVRVMARVAGYVRGGGEAHYYDSTQGPFDEVEAPEGSSVNVTAVRVQGDSMAGEYADENAILFYEERRSPPTDDQIGRLCVIELPDGRSVVKRLRQGSKRGLYHLESPNASTMFDQRVRSAALVTWIKPS
jgi:phage repressor protein C with HTH and peptisase S24 domain